MARGNFGERLKREREMREVSIEELTKATRISTRFVEALEMKIGPGCPAVSSATGLCAPSLVIWASMKNHSSANMTWPALNKRPRLPPNPRSAFHRRRRGLRF